MGIDFINFADLRIANSSYIYITVMLTKLIFMTIKCFILFTTPFDFIIGRNTIEKHHLVNTDFLTEDQRHN